MKRVVAALLLVVMLLGLTACGAIDDTTYGESMIGSFGFRLIEEFGRCGDTTVFLVYDPNTGVEYLFTDGYNTTSICPYYNSDGTVAIYNGK